MKKETSQLIPLKKKKKRVLWKLYANEFDKLGEMDNFLETYSPLKPKQEEIGYLNRPITRNKIEYIIKKKNSPQKKKKKKSKTRWLSRDSTKQKNKNLCFSFLNYSKRLKRKNTPKDIL